MLLDKIKNYQVYLVSKSPRRHEMLKGMDIPFTYLQTNVKEYHPEGFTPVQVAEFLSQHKLSPINVSAYADNAIFIGCDTIVVYGEHILEKPKDEEEAFRMLKLLSGNEHNVISGLTVRTSKQSITSHRKTRVRFKEFTESELHYYIKHYSPLDKAGAYGIQEWIGYTGIDYIEGSFFNVMGLPTQLLWDMLTQVTS